MNHKGTKLLIILLLLIISLNTVYAIGREADIYYTFDNGTLSDSYGNYTATNSGTTNASGIIYSSRSFDGTNDYFYSDNTIFDTGNVFSINYWLYIASAPDGADGLITKRTATIDFDHYFTSASGDLTMRMVTDAGTKTGETAATVGTGGWHMITILINGSQDDSISIFIDGTESDSTGDEGTFTTINDASGAVLTYGSLNRAGFWLNGLMDEVGIWKSYYLNTTELSELYASGTPTLQPPLVAGAPPSNISNFSVTAKNHFTDAALNNFNISIDGQEYGTTTGTITTNLYQNDTNLYNITIYNANDANGYYFNNTFYDVNISNNYLAYVTQNYLTINATSVVDNATISGNIWASSAARGGTGTILNWTGGSIATTFYNTTGGWFNQTVTLNIGALQNTTTTIEEIYSSILNISAKDATTGVGIASFSGNITQDDYGYYATFSTTNGTVKLPLLKNHNYTVYIVAPTYSISQNYSSSIIETNNIETNATIYLYKWNSINLRFYEELTNTLVNHQNISFDLISSVYSNNYSTPNGTLYITLLDPANYTARYSADGYTERFYYFNVFNNSYNNITLYLLNTTASTNVTIKVIDQVGSPVPNALVKALRYNLATNSYLLQEIGETNNDGQTHLSLQLNTEYYKFIVEYQGNTVLTTTPSYLTSDDITLQISLGTGIGTAYYDYESLQYSLGFNTGTDTFILNYNDVGGVTTQVCLALYELKVNTQELLNSSCSTTASGSILQTVYAPTNGSTYAGIATYIDQSSNTITLASSTHTYPSTNVFGTNGLFWQLLLSLVILMITLLVMHPSMLGFTIPLSLLLGNLMQINQFSIPIIIGLIVVGGIISFLLGGTQQNG